MKALTLSAIDLARVLTLALALVLTLLPFAHASIDVYEFQSAQQEQQFRDLTKALRCPKCQNQAISDSDAQIAQDMRAEVADMVRAGHSEKEVVGFFVERYGDYVSYDPPLKPETVILWVLPIFALLWGIWLIVGLVKRAASLPTDLPSDAETQQEQESDQ